MQGCRFSLSSVRATNALCPKTDVKLLCQEVYSLKIEAFQVSCASPGRQLNATQLLAH